MPVLVAPMAYQAIAHEDHELGDGARAAAAGTVMCLSTVATATPPAVAEAAGGAALWLQLYVFRDREVSDEVISGRSPTGSRRSSSPPTCPSWASATASSDRSSEPPSSRSRPTRGAGAQPGDERAGLSLLDAGLEWGYVTELRERWNVPVVVKGLVTGEDAELACAHGAAGVVVSNHGGRQLDGAVAALDALPEVVEAVAGRAEVYLDGGVRRGTDVVTALALGARAVLVGRPALYGLALGGEKGVRQVLEILRDETENALALLGCRSPDEVTAAHVTGPVPA